MTDDLNGSPQVSASTVSADLHQRPRYVVHLVGRVVPAVDCPVCGRSRVQHGRFTCIDLDAIAARVTHGRLPRWRRIITRRPEGWRR